MFESIKRFFKPQFTWKYIDLDNGLVEEIRQAYLNNLPDYSNGTYFFQMLDIDLPLIKGKRVVTAGLIYSPGNANTRFAHKDPIDHINGSSPYALNIPLINCENSKTTLYKDRKPMFIVNSGHMRKHLPPNAEYVEMQSVYKAKVITSYVLDRPILFNTRIFHGVVNNSPEPRIAISLRFAENPVEWL